MIKLKKSDSPSYMSHPGRFLKEELESRGWTQKQFAEIIGKSTSELSEVITGKRNITPYWALIIATAFDVNAETWLNLQKDYDLYLLRNSEDKINLKEIVERVKNLNTEKFNHNFQKKTNISGK